MNFNKLNNISGWIIFVIATIVYVLTVEPTASYWDCGEFISCSFKLMIPHPPGAPFFLLVGRIFSFFASDLTQVAYWVNMVSVLSSSFTTLFLFWSITLLAKKLVKFENQPSLSQSILIIASGAVGSLAYTFTDSAWFSAVEAEVYAMSSFFTAFIFWAILKWEAKADEEDSDKWILLIAFMTGLSTGVHLLNLVAIPALGFVYYFKKYPVSAKGLIITFLISSVVVISILTGVIILLPSIAGYFDVMFVNSFKLPFGSGIIFFIILLIGGLAYGIYYSIKNQKRVLNTALLCYTFIIIGFSTYGVILVRTLYNPPIDMNDPEDIMSFVSYLKREQYGDRPLLKGPYFTAYQYPATVEEGGPVYRKGKKKYEAYKNKYEAIYNEKHVTLLPRAYSNGPGHAAAYRRIMNLPKGKPTMADNLEFMFKYQIGTMYLRYFMWNFAGRQSDFQGAGVMTPFDSDDGLPYMVKENKARNNFYLIPLILGVIGLIYHLIKHKEDAFIVGLLFFFTGLAIVLYLNQPPIEPRERDYTFAGSFWAFSIWIGLAVIGLVEAGQKLEWKDLYKPVLYFAVLCVALRIIEVKYQGEDSVIAFTIAFVGGVGVGLVAIMMLVNQLIKNQTLSAVLATILCFTAPAILASEGWDDHNRSNRYHSVDSAKNLLESCAPNAILFTGGDNDTYPLWYAQEVEGFRTDVRVCNLSLLNTDWYITQMKRRSNKSAALPLSLPVEQYRDHSNDQIPIIDNSEPSDLKVFINQVAKNLGEKYTFDDGSASNIIPSKVLSLDVDKEKVLKSHIVPKEFEPFILDTLVWKFSNARAVDKKSLIMLDMIANNNWERPIYFSTTVSPSDFLNLHMYAQLEGMAYRILPVKLPPGMGQTASGWVNTDIMYDNMMKKFHWRGLDNPNVYYNDWYYNFTSSERVQFGILSEHLYMEGKKDKAKEVLIKSLKVMPDASIPFDGTIASYTELLFNLGEDKKAEEIIKTMGPRLKDACKYAIEIGDIRELEINLSIMQQFSTALRDKGKIAEASKYNDLLNSFLDQYQKMKKR